MATKPKTKPENKMGRAVFEQFEQTLQSRKDWFDQTSIERAGSRLVTESPYVCKSFEDAGFNTRESGFGMNVFRPNIRMEDFAVTDGQIGKITLATTEARAEVTADRIVRYPTVQTQAKRLRLNDDDIYRCVLEAAIRELMQVSFVGNLDMGAKAKEAAALAVIRRTAHKNGKFRGMLEVAGVDWTWDAAGVRQFAEEMDFEEFVQGLYRHDPYFNRRADLIDCARFETTQGKLDMTELGSPGLVENMLLHLIGKTKAVPAHVVRILQRSIAG
jgi:hypothetical protein